jgi:PAS domain S-box-containing protein
MPMDVEHGIRQPLQNWTFRLGFFLLVGGTCGLISKLLNEQIDELKKAKRQIQYILNNTKDVIFQVDFEGNYIYCNEAAEKLTGYPAAQLLRMNITQLVAPEHLSMVKERLQRRQAEEADGKPFEVLVQHKDGHLIWTELTTGKVCDSQDQIVAVQGVARDITERKQAAEALKLFRALMDQANDTVEVLDPKTGRFLDVNAKAAQIYGYTKEEYLGLTVFEVDPQFAQAGHNAWKAHLEALQQSGFLVFETEHRRKDRSLFPVEINASFIRLERDYILAVVRDITERKRTEEILQESESRHRFLFEHNPMPMLIYERETLQMLGVNGAFSEHFGYSLQEALSLRLTDLYPEEEKAKIAELIPHLHGPVKVGEWHHRKRDGSFLTSVVSSDDLEYHGRKARVAVMADITERKRAEESIRKSEQQFRLIMENLADLVALIDLDGRRLYNSPSYQGILGDPQKLHGTSSFDQIHAEDRARVEQAFQETVRTGVGQRLEYRMVDQLNQSRHIESQGSVIRDAQGRVAQVLIVSRDTTARKQAEQNIRRLNRV